jgi:hypothetical protein
VAALYAECARTVENILARNAFPRVDLGVLFAPLLAFARKKRAKRFGGEKGIVFPLF